MLIGRHAAESNACLSLTAGYGSESRIPPQLNV